MKIAYLLLCLATITLVSGCSEKKDGELLAQFPTLNIKLRMINDGKNKKKSKIEVSNLVDVPRVITCKLLIKDLQSGKLSTRDVELPLYPLGTHELLLENNWQENYEVIEVLSLQASQSFLDKVSEPPSH